MFFLSWMGSGRNKVRVEVTAFFPRAGLGAGDSPPSPLRSGGLSPLFEPLQFVHPK